MLQPTSNLKHNNNNNNNGGLHLQEPCRTTSWFKSQQETTEPEELLDQLKSMICRLLKCVTLLPLQYKKKTVWKSSPEYVNNLCTSRTIKLLQVGQSLQFYQKYGLCSTCDPLVKYAQMKWVTTALAFSLLRQRRGASMTGQYEKKDTGSSLTRTDHLKCTSRWVMV